MPFELTYSAEHDLIVIRVSGSATLEENHAIGLRLAETLEQVETNADVLFDLRTLEKFPTSISELRKTSAVIKNPKLGWIVLLTGDKPLLRFVATVLVQLQTRTGRIRAFDTLEKSIQFLQGLQPNKIERDLWLVELRHTLRVKTAPPTGTSNIT